MIDVLAAEPAPLVGPLGATRHDFDRRTVALSVAVASAGNIPRPSSGRRWSVAPSGKVIKRSSHGNGRYGCCVFTTEANLDETVCAQTGAKPMTNEDVVLDGYDRFTDFDRKTGANDNGASMLDGVKWAKSIGLFRAYADVEMGDPREVELAIDLTMGVQLSLALPRAWQTRAVWDTVPDYQRDASWDYGSWGGHSVCGVDYDRRGIVLVTWGGYKLLTWQALASYRKRDAFAGFHHALEKTPAGVLTPNGRTAAAILALLPRI